MQLRTVSIVVMACLGGGLAAGQPAPAPPPDNGRVDAKSLMASGVKLLEAGDNLGALAVFRNAYAQFPSAKIVLNIGTTLKLLKRYAEAANAYQHYLDSPDADAAKRGDVAAAVAELDRMVGTLAITITPADSEVQINDGEWLAASLVKLWRVDQGSFTVRARHAKFQTEAKTAHINGGEKAGVVIALTALPEDQPRIVTVPVDNGVHAGVVVESPRARIGGLALVHLDLPRHGAAALVGVTYDVTPLLEVQGAAILGPYYGGYAGAAFAILPGMFRPIVTAGMPIFFSGGVRVAVRASGGLEFEVNRHISLIAELGVEYLFNPGPNIMKVAFIPALGASGRL